MPKIDLYQGDCLTVMDDLIKQGVKVDAVITDPPYGTTACKWDSVIPLDKMWERCNKIIKDEGVIVLFSSQPFTTLLISSNIKNFKEELIWLKNKPASGMNHHKKHLKIHEQIEIFSNSNNYTYNPQKWLISEKEFITQRKTFKENEYVGNKIYGSTHRTRKVDTGERFPISIVSCKVPFTPQNRIKEYNLEVDVRLHPTQKPVDLMKYLIKTYSNENDTILDFTMGSGTTGVACKLLNRNFIGIELDENYFNIAKERIENTVVPKRLF